MDLLDEITTFERIARTGSLSAAGRDLRIATAGVSRRLSALESRLGVRLFQRSTRGLALTGEGSTLLARARDFLADAQSLETLFLEDAGQVSGLLRLSAPTRFGERYVVPAIEAFLHRHPAADVSLHLTDRHLDLVDDGLDLAVRIGPSPDSSRILRRLAVSTRIVCASPDYLHRMGTPHSPADLEAHDCLVLGDKDVWRFGLDGHECRVRVRPRLRCLDGDVVSQFCRRGLGVALKSRWDVFEDVAAGHLVPLLDHFTVEDDAMICVLLPSRRQVPVRVRTFLDCLRGRIGDPPIWQRSPDDPAGTE